jgi:hypothetical protein
VSYDLAVWEGSRPADDAAALVTYRELLERWQDEGVVEAVHAKMRGEQTAYDPTPAIAAYVADLLRRWPDSGDASEESPWADAPLINNATGPLFYFAMVYSMAEEAVTFAAELAAKHGLNCFDPQSEHLHTAASEQPQAKRPRWRRKG